MDAHTGLIQEAYPLGHWNAHYLKGNELKESLSKDTSLDDVFRLVVTDKELTRQDKKRQKILNAYLADDETKCELYKQVIENRETEKGRLVAGFMMNKFGVAMFLDHIKQVSNDSSLSGEERGAASEFLRSFWEGIVPIKEGKVVFDWNEFYTEISKDLHPMTEVKEGDRRVAFLLEKLGSFIASKDLIVDVGCGDGWLTRRLSNQNYRVVGLDSNQRYLDEAEKIGGRFVRGDFKTLRLDLQKNKLKPVVEIVNGRTIMHFKERDLIQLNAPIIIFDCLDPNTGLARERLDKFRDKLTQYGFDRKWLDSNFWNLLGSIDNGDHLAERLALPEQKFKEKFERRGYSVVVRREENYDGRGTDNLVYVCTKDDIYGKRADKYYEGRNYVRQEQIKPSNKFYTGLGYAVFGY